MVELKVRVGNKGQILVPKILRKRYGINQGESVSMEPLSEGLLIKGRPTPDEIMGRLNSHVERIRAMKTKEPGFGDLKRVYLEVEFEEGRA